MNLRERMTMDLELKGLSQNTKDAYIRYVKGFADFFGKSPAVMGEAEIREYLHHLITEKKVSNSYIKGVYGALRFLYQTTLQRGWNSLSIPRTKAPKRLPVILDGSEIKQLLAATTNLKHKALLMTTYGAGLRVSETANLRPTDIDSKRMQIRVNQGKGKKDRYSLLSTVNLNILREYWKLYHPSVWLFPGSSPDNQICTRTIQKVFESNKEKAGIKKQVTLHSLRHSFATHLLETGTDINYIQRLMGHSSSTTTAIYIHLKKEDLLKIVSPLDYLLGTDITNG